MMSVTEQTSSGVPGIFWTLLIAGLFAWRGYHTALEVERSSGRSPYGWEPVTWSIICFCTTLFGRLLLAAAASRERGRAPARPGPVPTTSATWAPATWAPPTWAPPTQAGPIQPRAASSQAPAPAPAPVDAAPRPQAGFESEPAPDPQAPPATALPPAVTILPSW